MKVLLKTVYAVDYDTKYEEIGIASIAAYLREKKYEVLVLGSTFNKIDYEKIRNYNPDVVGLTIYGKTKDVSYKFIDKIKEYNPSIIVCVGGYLATTHDQAMMSENKNIDYVIRGEGEVPFYNLLENIRKGEPELSASVTYRHNNEILKNKSISRYEDLSSYPMPSRDYLIDHNLNTATCFFSRGCTAGCHFCSSPSYWKRWRGRTVGQVVDEIKYLSSLGVRYLLIQDCSFENPGSHYNRVLEIAQAIKELNLDIRYFVAFRAEFSRKLDDQLVQNLRDSGLFLVNIGIEAGNNEDLKLYGKPANIDDNQRMLDILSKNNIGYKMGFMNFNTYSTFERLRENLKFLESNNLTWRISHLFSHYMAFQGTLLYDKISKEGLIINGKEDNTTYKFADNKVGKLFHYMNGHLSQKMNLEEVLIQIHLLDSINVALYEFYNRFEDISYLKPLENKFNEELKNCSRVNEEWFGNLLDYFESEDKIDYHIADRMVWDTIHTRNSYKSFEKANTVKYEILSHLYQNEKYAHWLTNSFYTHMIN